MRVEEIRCRNPVAKTGVSSGEDKNILLYRGTTVLYFKGLNAVPAPMISIQSALCSHEAVFSDTDKKKFFQAFYQDEFTHIHNSFEKKVAALTTMPGFSLLFANDISRKLLTSASDDQSGLMLRGVVGAESELLAQRLNWNQLLDDSVEVVSQRNGILELKQRLEQSRENLTRPAQGKLYRTRSELISVLNDPVLKKNTTDSDMANDEEVRQLKDQLQSLREKDDKLRIEQRTLMLLSIKNDYESLLKLRRELKELENNASRYAQSITGQGRDITVHELTVLSNLHHDYQIKEKAIKLQREELEKAREERFQWEQKRILAEYKLKQLKDKAAEADYEKHKSNQKKSEPSEHKADTNNKSSDKSLRLKHILLVAGLFLAFLGILFFERSRAVSAVSLVLAVVGLISSFYLFIRSHTAKQTSQKKALAESLGQREKTNDNNLLHQQLSEQKFIWQSAASEAEKWGVVVNREQIALHTLEQSHKKEAIQLLRELSCYAAVDNLDDAEYVLDALRNQRQSATTYDESVAELLRQIAEVRKGRTDKDMLREYEHACEELYGDLLTGSDAGGENLNARSQSLHYDENRAKRIEIERVELSQEISRIRQQLQEAVALRRKKEEILSRFPELSRKRDLLEQILWQEIEDVERLDLAITWLDYLYNQWRKVCVNHLRTLTLKYSRRLQGLKALEFTYDDFMIDKQRGIRRGEINKFKSGRIRENELELISSTPSDIIYLAFRMALLDSRKEDLTPLFIFDLPFLNSSSRVSELLNLLEERMLELSAQSVFFTKNELLTEIARERQIPVHQI